MPPALYSGPVKRLLDILASAALLVLLAPVMLLTWVAVRLVLGKPALYREERAGLGGRPLLSVPHLLSDEATNCHSC